MSPATASRLRAALDWLQALHAAGKKPEDEKLHRLLTLLLVAAGECETELERP